MNLYTKDYLLDGKIIYFQPNRGYRSGIEPIILASKASSRNYNILDMGSGCGPISLIIAHRYPQSKIIGIEKNEIHFQLAEKNKIENNLKNLHYLNNDVCNILKGYKNYFDLILTNPPFFFEDEVIKSENQSICDAKYTTKKNLKIWFSALIEYLSPNGTGHIINRYDNLDLMKKIFHKMPLEVIITPLVSFKDSKPKNVLLSLKKNEKYVEKIENDFIIHSNSSDYSEDLKNWLK